MEPKGSIKMLYIILVSPIDHIAVASQSPPALLRNSSATRDLWLCKISIDFPLNHIAVASQSPPTLLRTLSAARDLWLCKKSMAPIDQPFVAVGNRIPHGTIFVSARATIAQKVALWLK